MTRDCGERVDNKQPAFLVERSTGSRINFVSLCEDKILRDDKSFCMYDGVCGWCGVGLFCGVFND